MTQIDPVPVLGPAPTATPDADPTPLDAELAKTPLSDPRWLYARDLFLGGLGGARVAAAIGVSPSTFWERAREGGWRRRDQVFTPPPPPPPIDMEADVPDLDVAVDRAWRHLYRALEAGQPAEIAQWQRIHAGFVAQLRARAEDERKRARQDIEESVWRNDEIVGRLRHEVDRFNVIKGARATLKRAEATGVDLSPESLESLESVVAGAAFRHPAEPGLNRAERRRRRKFATHNRPG